MKIFYKIQEKYSDNSFSKDFSVTPKLTYAYLITDISATDRVSVVEEKGIF
ncbi:MAG: hypothetical protein U5K55_06610 [Aliarcobacter sp.]|nr:hypothetical protein [Aliarcobacter sp.]